MQTLDKLTRAAELAAQILNISRNTLVVNMRYLDAALFRLKPQPSEISFATDGVFLCYDPFYILSAYKAEKNGVTRDYLYVLLHCIFRHPSEYNNSVREFDIVTWDRLKRIDVEPNFDVCREYAYNIGVHPAVITYLEIKKADFYSVESIVDGKRFVTARGWVDLSDMLKLFEKKKFPVTETLIVQYLQNPVVAKHFAIYYDLFNKYRSDYQIDTILSGEVSEEICGRAKKAKFDERLSLLGLLLDATLTETREAAAKERVMHILMDTIKNNRVVLSGAHDKAGDRLIKMAEKERADAKSGKRSGMLSSAESAAKKMAADVFDKMAAALQKEHPEGTEVFGTIKKVV